MTKDNMPDMDRDESALLGDLHRYLYQRGEQVFVRAVDWAHNRHVQATARHQRLSKQASTLTHLEEENARLREALEWYAHQAALMGKITIDANFAQDRLKADRGTRARTAISASEGEG